MPTTGVDGGFTPRWFGTLVLCLGLAVGCGGSDVRVRRTNVVLLSVDTWRADHLSLYGYGRPTTPALERLAADAIVFDHAFSASPHTAPSHMSLLTGVPPLAHGVVNIGASPTVRVLPASYRTLAEMLKAHGYETAAFTAGGNVRKEVGFDRGFDTFEKDGATGMNGNREYSLDPSHVLAWLDRAAKAPTPFFLFLHTYIPHAPYLPPPPYDSRYDPGYRGLVPSDRAAFFAALGATADFREISTRYWRLIDRKNPADVAHLIALYDGECNAADDAVAVFARAIADRGLADRTIFVVTSDHGELFGEHDDFIHPGELWDELIHVPLIIAAPGTRGRGRRVTQPVSALDVVPTLLDLLTLPADPQPLGRSLLPLITGTTWADRFVVSEFLVAADPASPLQAPVRWLRSLRTADHKLIRRGGFVDGDLLFDLRSDPREDRNLVHDASLAGVRERLLAASKALDDAEAVLRAPAATRRLSDETMSELRALGYVE